jgi:hypothetical protein
MNARLLAVAMLLVLSAGAHAAAIIYSGSLSGPAESPANASPGVGTTVVSYDAATHMLNVQITFTGLSGTTTASHIHCCTTMAAMSTAGVATQVPTFSSFPLGVAAGTYSMTFDLTMSASWNATFITANGSTPAGAEAALVSGLQGDKAYLNIHSSTFPGGEIRSFLTPDTVFANGFEP